MTSLVAGASVVVQPLVASATTFDVDAVDVTVVVESDGHTTVKNIVTWNVIGGTMGGFDFMNPAIRPDAFLTKLSYAESEKNHFLDNHSKSLRREIKAGVSIHPENVCLKVFPIGRSIMREISSKAEKSEKRRIRNWGISISLIGRPC